MTNQETRKMIFCINNIDVIPGKELDLTIKYIGKNYSDRKDDIVISQLLNKISKNKNLNDVVLERNLEWFLEAESRSIDANKFMMNDEVNISLGTSSTEIPELFSLEFIKKHYKRFNKETFNKLDYMDDDLIYLLKDQLDWNYVTNKHITIDNFDKFVDYIDFQNLTSDVYNELPIETIRKYKHKIDWNIYSIEPNIRIAREFKDEINWNIASMASNPEIDNLYQELFGDTRPDAKFKSLFS